MIKRNMLYLVLILTLLGLTGCSAMSVKLGWVGNATPGHSEARFARFRGEETYSVRLEEDEALVLLYTIGLDEGSLELRVLDGEDRVVWAEGFETSAARDARIAAGEAGWYTLVVAGDDAAGNFDLFWSVD